MQETNKTRVIKLETKHNKNIRNEIIENEIDKKKMNKSKRREKSNIFVIIVGKN